MAISMKRHPNIAFFGGTVVIALMVLAAFSNMAVAGGCARSGDSNRLSSEQVEQKQNNDADA
jgi:hypothetical protein